MAAELVGADDGALAGLAGAAAALDGVAGVDAALDRLGERLRTAALEAQDVVSELRDYGDALGGGEGEAGGDGGRLEASRSGWRRSPDSSASTAGRSPRCSRTPSGAPRGGPSSSAREDAIAAAREEAERARTDHERAARVLGEARARAAPGLAAEVCARLEALAMADASFAVVLQAAPARAERVATPSSSRSRRTRACRRPRCGTRPRAASSRG